MGYQVFEIQRELCKWWEMNELRRNYLDILYLFTFV